MIESLWLQSGPCTRYATYAFSRAINDRVSPEVDYDHRAMVNALERRDPDAARTALATDIAKRLKTSRIDAMRLVYKFKPDSSGSS